MIRKPILALCLILALAFGASAQRVGVVMSGGGAKGLYHIGVLKALEENGVPVDYVAGTSMGSIIAGLYAAGYSPEEMEAIVASGQIKEWVSGRLDNSRYRDFYREIGNVPAAITAHIGFHRAGRTAQAAAAAGTDLLHPDRHGPHGPARSGIGRGRRRFRPSVRPLPVRGGRPQRPAAGRHEAGQSGGGGAGLDVDPAGLPTAEKDSMLLYDGGIYNNFPGRPSTGTSRPTC